MSKQSEILNVVKMLKPYDPVMRKLRVGSCGDGGYVLPDDLDQIEGVLSIGIGNEDSFDLFFAKKNIPIFQYDHTVDGAVSVNSKYHFNKIAWSNTDGVSTRTLETMIKNHSLEVSNNSILKFDTEGAEWECLPDINSDLLKYFRIIVCELHGLTSIGDLNHRSVVRKTLQNLTKNHTVVHLHANNCCGISLVEGVPIPAVVEVTLLRNDRSSFKVSNKPIPGSLDYPNMKDRPELVLSAF